MQRQAGSVDWLTHQTCPDDKIRTVSNSSIGTSVLGRGRILKLRRLNMSKSLVGSCDFPSKNLSKVFGYCWASQCDAIWGVLTYWGFGNVPSSRRHNN